MTESTAPLLKVDNLHTHFHTAEGTVKAVDGVDFELERGEIVGLVGESGSGKTVTAKSILQLIRDPGEIVDGTVEYKGNDLLNFDDDALQTVRGDDIAIVFQNTSTALNPTQTIGWQFRRILKENTDLEPDRPGFFKRLFTTEELPRDELDEKIGELFEEVGLAGGLERIQEYPHEFSGGMIQRALIAMVLGCEPEFIIADEPTTALDVTIEAQILKLFWQLREQLDTTILFITHDLGVVSELCDRVIVMYAGRVVERAQVEELFADPKHPYTEGLLGSIPRLDEQQDRLPQIEGTLPDPTDIPTGCRFAPRCPKAVEACHEIDPDEYEVDEANVACILYDHELAADAAPTSTESEVGVDE